MRATPVGFDFGTSNSVLAIIEEGNQKPTFIKTSGGDVLHGSYVFYPENSAEPPIFGVEALALLPHPNVVRIIKRGLGMLANRIADTSIFNAEVSNPGKQSVVKFNLRRDGGVVVKKAKDIVIDFLKHFKALVDAHVNGPTKWVVSKPQYWNGQQHKAFVEALEGAGIDYLVILPEPTAAMFSYRAKSGENQVGQKTCIVDIGAGTTDSVLQEDVGDGNYVNRCGGGDDLLGSSNMDELLLAALKEELKEQAGYSEVAYNDQLSENREKVRQLKHLLSTLPKASTRIPGITTTIYTFEVDQAKKAVIFKPFYDQLKLVLMAMFEKAAAASKNKYTAKQIIDSVETVAMVGGGSKDIDIGNKILPELFPKSKIVGKPNHKDSVNPDVAVSTGNCFWAAALLETPTVHGLPPEPVFAPVLSQDLGVESVSGYGKPDMQRWFTTVINANTSIPTSAKTGGFTTVTDNQEKVMVFVYQGTGRKTTEDSVSLIGSYEVPIETPNTKGVPNIEVEMEVTEDNLVIVRAGEVGKPKEELTVDNVSL